MKIVFFGTPSFAANVLAFLIEKKVEVVAVVTKIDKPRKRSSKPVFNPVKKWVLGHCPDLPLYQVPKASEPSFQKILASYKADLFVVVAYGEIIKENLLKTPRFGAINLHTSLLPKYRGAAPIQFALLNGEAVTGVTVIEMDVKMDAGDIIAQKSIPIDDEINFEALEKKLLVLGKNLLFEVILDYEKGKVCKRKQNALEASYVQKITPEMGEIFWERSAEELHNQVRALSPKPGAWSLIKIGEKIKRLKILKSRVFGSLQGPCGKALICDRKRWVIGCGVGALELLEVQLEGKKRLSVLEFLRGNFVSPSMFFKSSHFSSKS